MWKWFLGGCLGLIGLMVVGLVALVIVLGVAIERGTIPSSEAVPGNKLPVAQLRQIQEAITLGEGERILYFYSAALLSSTTDGNLFTNQRVISYSEFDGETVVTEATYDQVTAIDFHPSSHWVDDSTISISVEDGTVFDLWVSNDADRDQEFYNRLVKQWESNRTDVDPGSAPDDAAEEETPAADSEEAEVEPVAETSTI